MSVNITGHKIVYDGDHEGVLNGLLYKYLYAANGIFLTAKNQVFKTTIPISLIKDPTQYVRGLEVIQPEVLLPKRVPAQILSRMVYLSRQASPNEILFYLSFEHNEWILLKPYQNADHCFAQPINDCPYYIPIEVHSHNTMPAIFSGTDNADENGLRIYGVLGRVDQPVVDFRLRISIYGHWSVLPYQLVFEPTTEVKNG